MNYSHTRISTFENCPLQYKYRYIERPTVTLGVTIEVFMGRRVHETLEDLYRDLGMTRLPELEALLDYYRAGWEKHWDENIRVIRKEYTPDDYREKGRRCIEDYYRRYYPFDQGRTIGIEERVRVPLGSDRVLTGFIDRLDRVGEGIYEIHDYKTSSHLPTQEEIDRDRQLALYQMDIQNRWRDVKEVILVWHYLVFDRELRSTRTPRDQEELLAEINKVIDQIEAATEYEPRESSLCDWCDFQNICPLWKHVKEVEELPVNEYKKEPGVKLVAKYAKLEEKRNEFKDELHKIEDEQGKIKEAAIEYAEKKKIAIIDGPSAQLKVDIKEEIKIPLRPRLSSREDGSGRI